MTPRFFAPLNPSPRNLPEPFKKIRRNEPCLLPVVLHTLATCMKVTDQCLADHSTRNAIQFFGLPKND